MRLSVIFLLVLSLSTIITSMAAWGTIYGTSHDRVSAMASQFYNLAQQGLTFFGTFVTDMLHSSTDLVTAILSVEEESGANRTEQTKAQITRSIGILVNYTTHSTEQAQQQMDDVVDTFSDLMDVVLEDFKALASNYAVQLRSSIAAKGMTAVTAAWNTPASVKKRIQQLVDVGVLDLSRTPTDPIGEADCTLLGVLCDGAAEASSVPLVVVSATGRLYSCGVSAGCMVSTISYNGSSYNESYLTWRLYPSSIAAASRQTMKQRCLSELPDVEIVDANCPSPPNCACGADQRCATWYQRIANSGDFNFHSVVYVEPPGVPRLHSSLPLVNSSATPPTLLGVVDASANLSQGNNFLNASAGNPPDTYLALLLNDTNLTVLGSFIRQCAENETGPVDPRFPPWSALRSCDPGLRAVAWRLYDNRSVTQSFILEDSGLLWDIYPGSLPAASYFFIFSTNKSLVNSAIDACGALANSHLDAVRTELTSKVANTGAATRAYVAAVGMQNIQATQAMQDRFFAELQAQENATRASLAASQQRTSAYARSIAEAEAAAVEEQKVKYLNIMATTAGWTVAVVFSILLPVLLLSAWGTIQVTKSLTHIIGLMEDVADMKVENLTVPQNSNVEEVARIQIAFQVMVERLAQYKSYLPAGVFEKEGTVRRDPAEERMPAGQGVAGAGCQFSGILCDAGSPPNPLSASTGFNHKQSSGLEGLPLPGPPSPGRRSARRTVAALSINVLGFTDLLLDLSDGMTKSIFNEYVLHVHGTVSQARGNVDFLAGDQIFVTFNAHIPCIDPAGAAAAAALDVRQELLTKLGDRLKFQIGVSFGPALIGSVGYAKFKFMVTLGSPMKVASILSHVDHFQSGTILVDVNLEERMKYSYNLQPAELVHLPRLKNFDRVLPESQRIFLLMGKKHVQEGEWLYQMEDPAGGSDWSTTFDRLVAATSIEEVQRLLQQHLADHPDDSVALRLRDRLPLWVPGRGITL